MKSLLSICIFVFFCANHGSSYSDSLVDRYIAAAIQGDLRAAARWFAPAAIENDPVARDLAKRFDVRFIAQSEPRSPASGDNLVDAVVAAYRGYWVRALLGEMLEVESRAQLERSLSAILHKDEASAAALPNDTGRLYEQVAMALRSRGFQVLLSPAPPLSDLLVWRAQQSTDYDVELADGQREVSVHFMTDFASQGWKDYAALGLATTSGWVENGELYCVAGSYDVESEAFAVSYLKHESRHLVDFERFPGLSSVDLEYRAKLTELSFAASTLHRLLTDFTLKGADNPGSPHAQANHRVIHDLYRELYGGSFTGGASVWYASNRQRVNQAARRLLERDTLERERAAPLSPAMESKATGK
jgi:hypothetical protein